MSRILSAKFPEESPRRALPALSLADRRKIRQAQRQARRPPPRGPSLLSRLLAALRRLLGRG